MSSSAFTFFVWLHFAIAALHVDKLILTGNDLYNSMNYSYYHDKRENVHVDFAIRTKAVAIKMLLYITANIAENKDDRRMSREFIKTVIDFDKLVKGLYGNPIISGFMKSIAKDLDALNLKSPLPIVSCDLKIFL